MKKPILSETNHLGSDGYITYPDPWALADLKLDSCKALLKKAEHQFDQQFSTKRSIRRLLRARASFMDQLLKRLWEEYPWQQNYPIALVGTGGYGREELHPHSDVDLLILVKDEIARQYYKTHIENFVAFSWTLKLNISQSVRTPDECYQLSKEDVAVFTSLLESRIVAGNHPIYIQLMKQLDDKNLWPSKEYCTAKLAEQTERHNRFSNVVYHLQPDIKKSAGGLREIQTLLWITRRHFQTKNLNHLVNNTFLSRGEVRLLRRGRNFLWQIRYLLHTKYNRAKDRLDFEAQQKIAHALGYRDTPNRMAIESFMKVYYRWVFKLGTISELLVRHFEENILLACDKQDNIYLNQHFMLTNGYIAIRHPNVFKDHPATLLQIFLWVADNPNIIGIRAATLRQLARSRYLIGDDYRKNSTNIKCFMQIMQSKGNVSRALQWMRRHEILGYWLPEFQKLVGQMQHDLFHDYTVDEHLIQVTKQINQMLNSDISDDKDKDNTHLLLTVAHRIPKTDLLYIAGLYHDIAKGRGGDHSLLGVGDTIAFGRRHKLHDKDIELLGWLVRHHLHMSITAQRADTNDLNVIKQFVNVVGNIERMNYLYVLTVADIKATNTRLWDPWRAMLLQQLYINARQYMLIGDSKDFAGHKKYLASIKDQCLQLLKAKHIAARRIKAWWLMLNDEYFIRESTEDIVWHTENIVQNNNQVIPLVDIRTLKTPSSEDSIKIFVYAHKTKNLFYLMARILERAGMNIQYAHIINTKEDYILASFFVQWRQNAKSSALDSLAQTIRETLLKPNPSLETERQHMDTPAIKDFKVPLYINIRHEKDKIFNIIELSTIDRNGLLSCIGHTIGQLDLKIIGARITTLGERVEDIFYITDQNDKPIIDKDKYAHLEHAIATAIDPQWSAQHNKQHRLH